MQSISVGGVERGLPAVLRGDERRNHPRIPRESRSATLPTEELAISGGCAAMIPAAMRVVKKEKTNDDLQ
jgi:hypothetical protein